MDSKTENPAGGRGSALVLKGCVVCIAFILQPVLAVKLWTLRWLLTLTSEMGKFCYSIGFHGLNRLFSR